MSKRPGSKHVKEQLFLKCGRVDMYNMKKYSKEKLTLHHHPPFRETRHTIYEESYLLSPQVHSELHKIEMNNYQEYLRIMEIIKKNKKILERKREQY